MYYAPAELTRAIITAVISSGQFSDTADSGMKFEKQIQLFNVLQQSQLNQVSIARCKMSDSFCLGRPSSSVVNTKSSHMGRASSRVINNSNSPQIDRSRNIVVTGIGESRDNAE